MLANHGNLGTFHFKRKQHIYRMSYISYILYSSKACQTKTAMIETFRDWFLQLAIHQRIQTHCMILSSLPILFLISEVKTGSRPTFFLNRILEYLLKKSTQDRPTCWHIFWSQYGRVHESPDLCISVKLHGWFMVVIYVIPEHRNPEGNWVLGGSSHGS